MAEHIIPAGLLSTLRSVDTPTVCNAIEVAMGQRGFSRFTEGTMQHSAPEAPPIVGTARTAKIAGLAPPAEPPEIIRQRRMDYFRSMAAGPEPAVAVIEDTDFPECAGAWWGEVHAAIHKGLGLAGAITNGAMRDLGAIGGSFSILAGSIAVSHRFVHAVELGTEVNILGLDVRQGELVHADIHGALVIPWDIVPEIQAAIDATVDREAIVLGPAREPGFNLSRLEEVWAEFEARRI